MSHLVVVFLLLTLNLQLPAQKFDVLDAPRYCSNFYTNNSNEKRKSDQKSGFFFWKSS